MPISAELVPTTEFIVGNCQFWVKKHSVMQKGIRSLTFVPGRPAGLLSGPCNCFYCTSTSTSTRARTYAYIRMVRSTLHSLSKEKPEPDRPRCCMVRNFRAVHLPTYPHVLYSTCVNTRAPSRAARVRTLCLTCPFREGHPGVLGPRRAAGSILPTPVRPSPKDMGSGGGGGRRERGRGFVRGFSWPGHYDPTD